MTFRGMFVTVAAVAAMSCREPATPPQPAAAPRRPNLALKGKASASSIRPDWHIRMTAPTPARIEPFAPDLVIISAGFDAHRRDPLAHQSLEEADYAWATRAVVEAFSTNGRLRVVSAAEADAVLDGEVVGYSVYSIAFDKDANVRQYRLVVSVNLQLRDRRKNEVLFKQSGVREQVDFRVQNAVSQTISLEETALKAAAVEVGRSIASLTITRF